MNIKLIGSKIVKIDAYRNPDFEGKLKLESNVNIKSIDNYDVKTQKADTVRVIAVYSIDYGELGKIEIEGHLFLSGEKKDLKTIVKFFSEKNYNTPEMIGIMNFVLQKFSIKAFELEEELGLPIHIKLPSLQPKKS